MIIRCEECDTRFRLDEARIPERGARVRCSRCNHSFVVRVPTSDTSDAVLADTLAKDAARDTAAASTPEAKAASRGASDTEETAAAQAEEDDDWEFGPSEADVPAAENKDAPASPSPLEDEEDEEDEVPAADPLSDLLSHEDGADRANAAVAPADSQNRDLEPGGAPPDLDVGSPNTEDGAASSAFDIDDPFGESGADLSRTGNLEIDDRDFEAAAADVAAQGGDGHDANADSLAAIGDPSSWDLLADDAGEGAVPTPPAAPPPAAPPRSPSVEADPLFPPTDLFSSDTPEPASDPFSFSGGVDPLGAGPELDDEPGESAWFRSLGRAGTVAAWPLLLILAAVAATRFFTPAAPLPTARSVALERGFEISELESRVIENELGGPLLVVSGTVRNNGSGRQALESAVAITLLGTEGQRFDEARVLMGPSPSPTAVREMDPAHLQSQSDYAARSSAFAPFAPGEARHVSAVFEEVPGGATRFLVGLQQVPAPPRPTSHMGPPRPDPLPRSDGTEIPVAPRGLKTETARASPSEALPSRE